MMLRHQSGETIIQLRVENSNHVILKLHNTYTD